MQAEGAEVRDAVARSFEESRLRPKDIPDLALYNDQIITLFEDKLGASRRKEGDKILTKAMINNYSKEKLLCAIHGKKYSREQVLQLLLICQFKGTLKVADIKLVMQALMLENAGADGLEAIFEDFFGSQSDYSDLALQVTDRLMSRFGERMETADLVSALLTLSSLSGHLRRAAENIIDLYFTPHSKKGQESSDL